LKENLAEESAASLFWRCDSDSEGISGQIAARKKWFSEPVNLSDDGPILERCQGIRWIFFGDD
jgi:hypothetical protein